VRLIQGLTGTEATTGAQVRLRDMSRDAFALESSKPFDIGRLVEFTFESADTGGLPLILHGKVRRCEKSVAAQGPGKYLVGSSFAWKTPSDRLRAEAVIRVLKRSAG
jgi:hypothetical protein